ncbi:Hypothetical protein LUCI_0982 [Lucifera butyrica]|uniref:4'-phosphopantetheinyl transferase domain-containing protein n=1 Tax=Lucifera butyrica TaxID=1351585 RepID=A0A498R302_9FIRM|nr:4'-phosphopantetheinyl transferase superfamily protein [Lucifera butyrica]VBB05771.1 Hypothetical protein LUCI_0982 [Lucifera butyrica]
MGIDIEKIDSGKKVFAKHLTAAEKRQMSVAPLSPETGLTLLWTVKEALAKVLKTGFMTPFEVFEISEIQFDNNCVICYYKNFTQYKAIAWVANQYICSIAQPLSTRISFRFGHFLNFLH